MELSRPIQLPKIKVGHNLEVEVYVPDVVVTFLYSIGRKPENLLSEDFNETLLHGILSLNETQAANLQKILVIVVGAADYTTRKSASAGFGASSLYWHNTMYADTRDGLQLSLLFLKLH